MKVMFYVQHLLGIGHLVRASRVAAALRDAGNEVCVVSGGMPVEGFPPHGVLLEQLPPLRSADGEFSALVDEHGAPADDALREHRTRQLIAAFDRFQPECLIIEAYPFARRQMRFELVPLLDHVRAMPQAARAMVVSSVRDIIQPKSAQRDVATAAVVERYFELVLVHGDEAFAGFGETFSQAAAIAGRISYTGMVAPAAIAAADVERQFDVVVSAGGGAVGAALLDAAIAARPETSVASARWLIVTGPNLAQDAFDRLQVAAGPGIKLMRFEPALAQIICTAKVSVSQAGYNTVADILRAGCASVLVPFEGEGEREQLMRAGRLAKAGRAHVVREGDISAQRLAHAIDTALADGAELASPVSLEGAKASVAAIAERYAAFRRGQSA